MKFLISLLLAASVLSASAAHAAVPNERKLFKNPNCGCCDAYVDVLEKAGYEITVENVTGLDMVKKMAGVPEQLAGCHTLMIGDYVVEGLVPFDILNRLLTEQPDIRGIALPGMPVGAPGMPGSKPEPFTVYIIEPGPTPSVYAVE